MDQPFCEPIDKPNSQSADEHVEVHPAIVADKTEPEHPEELLDITKESD
jgi:hypothetical protein